MASHIKGQEKDCIPQILSLSDADKVELMCFNHIDASTSFNGIPIKLVNQFAYLISNISSSESDVNIRIVKVWTIIDGLKKKLDT